MKNYLKPKAEITVFIVSDIMGTSEPDTVFDGSDFI